jgi:heavy metal sensor kinase
MSLHYTLYDELDNELNIKATELASTISSYLDIIGFAPESFDFAVKRALSFDGEYFDKDEIASLDDAWLKMVDRLNLKEDYINFLDSNGKVLFSSGNLQLGSTFLNLKTIDSGDIIYTSIKYEKRNMRLINMPFSYRGEGQYIIQIASSLKPIIHLLQLRLFHIGLSIPVILIIASFFGRLFARRILNPVMGIAKAASNITHEDLSARVKAEHADEEMKYLVNSFNDMISRLEESFKYIAEFSSHVAHELKTPLAIIKGECEVTLRKDRVAEDYRKLIMINLEEVDRMLKIINDLLLLTRLDYKSDVFKFERLNIADFIRETYEQVEILASKKEITVNIDLPKGNSRYIKGDRLHLKRLLFNLLDNAIKFTPRNGRIDVSLNYKDEKAIVSISDTGIGIPKEDIPKIFNRFYRVDRNDQKIEQGAGLGLSIAHSIVKIHQGDMHVRSELNKGTTFSVTIPLL